MSRAVGVIVPGVVAAGYCVYWLTGAIRNGYFRNSRLYGHRYITREKEPRLYWLNFILMSLFLLLALLLVGWGVLLPNTLR